MLRITRRSIVVFSLGVFALAGCSSNAYGGSAATVGGTTITASEFTRELNALRANPYIRDQVAPNGVVSPEVVASFLQQDIFNVLVDDIFAERNLTVTPQIRESSRAQLLSQFASQGDQTGEQTFSGFPKFFQDQLLERQARTNTVIAAFAPLEPQAYYERNKDALIAQCKSGKWVRHIAVATKAQADQIVAQLQAGADFVVLARQSQDTSTAGQGGFVGCYTPGEYAPIYDNAVRELSVGQRTVIRTETGYDIIEANGPSPVILRAVIDESQRQASLEAVSKVLNERLVANPPTVSSRFGEVFISDQGFRVVAVGTTDQERIRSKPTPTTSPLSGIPGLPGR